MSEQDKEMESAAEKAFKAVPWPFVSGMSFESCHKNGFKSGWKAASERKDVAQYADRIAQLGLFVRERDAEIQSLQSKLATAEALIAKIEYLERDSIGSDHFGDRVYYAMKLYREGK